MNEAAIRKHFNRKSERVFIEGHSENYVLLCDGYVMFLMPRDSKVFAKRDEYPNLPDVGKAIKRDGDWEWNDISVDRFLSEKLWRPLDDKRCKITDTSLVYPEQKHNHLLINVSQRLFIGPDGEYITAMQQKYYEMLGAPRFLNFHQQDGPEAPIWVHRNPVDHKERPLLAMIMPVQVAEAVPMNIEALYKAMQKKDESIAA